VTVAPTPVEKTTIDVLIMKGGGVKGLAFAGAIRELERFFDFRAFVGTSAGAIAAALLAAGATGAQLEEKLRRKSFRDFLDGNIWTLPFTFWTLRGLHPGYSFMNWLRQELHECVSKYGDIRMEDLPKRAVLYASTKDAGEITFDKAGEHRDTAVHTAVRCSMSIPYFFQPQWVNNRRVYDGGLLHNYPVQIFLDQERQRNPKAPQPNFIALYLGSIKPRPLNPGSVLADLFSISIDKNDSKVIDRYRSQTILIDTEPIGTIDFDLTDQEKDYLVLQGRAAALRFLADHGVFDRLQLQSVDQTCTEAERLRATVIEARQKLRVQFRRRVLTAVIALSLVLSVGGLALYFPTAICNFVRIGLPWCAGPMPPLAPVSPSALNGGKDEPCTLRAPSTSFTVREKTAQEILGRMASVESGRRDSVFKELYINRFIAPGGWSGTIESSPDLKGGLCQFMASEDLTKARVLVNTCEKTCDFRKGDRVMLSGWLMRLHDDYIEIGAERHSILNKGVAEPNVPSPTAWRRVFVVCHGEHEAKCGTHPYEVFEHCGDDNGVGGADPKVRGLKLCGNENFEAHPAEGESIGGNHCGYSWFKIACK
jgi:predicted acylesterase/phospholipase RssA